jgi:hypothetical protein
MLAAAVLIKVSAALPLVAVVAWMGARYGWRIGVRVAAIATGVIAVGYAAAGGMAALEPMRQASIYRSKASVWSFPVSWVERTVLGVHRTNVHAVTAAAAVAVVTLTAVLAASRLRDLDPAIAAGGAVLVYLLGAAYVLPWYAGWGLPVLALAWRSRLALVAQLQAAVLLLVYVDRPGVRSPVFHDVVGGFATHVVPVVEGVVLVALVVVSTRRLIALRAGAIV